MKIRKSKAIVKYDITAKKNICFSVAEEVYKHKKDTKTLNFHKKTRRTRGFDDTETWHLDRTMAEFIIPRLQRFLEVNNGFPNGETEESYSEKIKFIINSLKSYYAYDLSHDQNDTELYKKLSEDAKQAVKYLSELWFDLWW